VWITEYSLSLDNLFIFIILMNKLKVPEKLQQFALLCGIILALVFRGVFIALGKAVLDAWAWVFFVFGLFLLYSAISLVREYFSKEGNEETRPDNWRLSRHGIFRPGGRKAACDLNAHRRRCLGQHRPTLRPGLHPGKLWIDE